MTDTVVQSTTPTKASAMKVRQVIMLAYAGVLLVIIFFALVRYRLRDMPLERDEGEYALSGQLLLQGIPPYKFAYNLKLPGAYAAYAAIMSIFGETPAGIHLGFLIVNAVTTVLIYILAARLFGRLAGVISAASYALLSTSPGILGFQAHATHFIVLPAIVAILLLLHALESRLQWLFFGSGVFAGISFLMKQHGFFVPIFCFLYLIVNLRRKREASCEESRDSCQGMPSGMPKVAQNRRAFRRWISGINLHHGRLEGTPSNLHMGGGLSILRYAAYFCLGVLLPCAITLALLYRAGVFGQFWFWTVSYAGEYSKMGLRRGVRVFLENFHLVAGPTALIWLLAVLGILVLRWSPNARKHSWFLIALLLLAFLAICPGVQFRPHYFVLLLPPVSLLAGVAVSSATEIIAGATLSTNALEASAFTAHKASHGSMDRRGRAALQDRVSPAESTGASTPAATRSFRNGRYLLALPALAFAVCFASTIYQQRAFYFSLTPQQALRAAYPSGNAIFLAAPAIGEYLRHHSSPTTSLAVIGSEPEICFYAHRRPATGYIYMYSLTEKQKYTDPMRGQMIHEIETNRPEYLVYIDAWDSWGYQNADAPHVAALFSWAKRYISENYQRVGEADLGSSIHSSWREAATTPVPRSRGTIYIFKRKEVGAR